MNKVNTLVLCKEHYKSEEEFEKAIKDAIMLLLNAEYIMTIEYDANDKEMGIVVIKYNYAELEFGDRYPYWLLPEEEESVVYEEEKGRVEADEV